ncbi:MAG: hypothetical protein ACREHC_03915 [Candidatus Levyibacteriota bacterium]
MRYLLFIKQPVFTVAQLNRLSNIFDNAGQVIFGIAVFSPIISGFDKANPVVLVLGSIAVIIFWAFSVWLAKKGE